LRAHKKGARVVISGYYGFGNCGDEAVLFAAIHCLKELKPDIEITVLSNNPAETSELYGVNAVQRWSPLKVLSAILSCDMLISGGGSLLQDVTSAESLIYYSAVIQCAQFFGKKVFIYSQGIGPLLKKMTRHHVARVLGRCCEITVRDERSATLLAEMGVKPPVTVTSDPVMALSRDSFKPADIDTTLAALEIPAANSGEGNRERPLLLAIIRPWAENSHIVPVAHYLDTQVIDGWDVLLVPAYYEQDNDIMTMIGKQMTQRHHILTEPLTAHEFIALVASADCVLSMRLHGLICAMAMGVPMLALSYDPKVDAFMEQAGLEKLCYKYNEFNCEVAGSVNITLNNLLESANSLLRHGGTNAHETLPNSADSGDTPAADVSDRTIGSSIDAHQSGNLPYIPKQEKQENEAQRRKMHNQAWIAAKKVVENLELLLNNH